MQAALFTTPTIFALWSVPVPSGLRATGVDHYWHQQDYNFVVHKINVKYSRPILMDDLITVTASVVSCKASSFVLQQNIYRGEIMLASGEVELACIEFRYETTSSSR